MSLGLIGNNIPKHWKSPLLVDLVTPKQWKTIPAKNLIEKGYVVYGANGKIGFYSEYTHEKPTLMITCRGATCGNLHISEPCSYINGNAMALDSQPTDLVSLEFLFYALKARGLEDTISGSAQPQITGKGLQEVGVPLPPLAEQKVISEKLDTLLAQVEATKIRLESTLETLKQFRQSVLVAAVSGKLTDRWRLSNGLEKNWQELTLGDVITDGPQNGIYKPSKLYGSGTKIIRIDGFYDGELCNWSTFKRVCVEKQEEEKWALKVNDILINRVNSIEYLGKCGLVRSLPEPVIFESNIMRISIDEGKAQPEFIKIFLSSIVGLERLRENAKLAVNQASINQTDVKSCQFELPDLDEQIEITRRVNMLFKGSEETEQKVNQALERVNNLTQSILAKAFRGELTEQWRKENPELISGENSTEALLKKIKAERAAAKPKRKTRTTSA